MTTTILTPNDWLNIAQSYFDSAAGLGTIINDNSKDLEVRTDAYRNSVVLIQYAHDFQHKALNELNKDITVDVDDLKKATQKAKDTVKKINNVKNILQLTGDLISLAAVISAPNPATLSGLPGILTSIYNDVSRFGNS